MAHDSDHTAKIAALNDHFRCTFLGGQVHLTPGVMDLDDTTRAHIMNQVMTFDAFTPENDPHGEHDFGSIAIRGGKVFWKIDLYDLELKGYTPDPLDPLATVRVLTIMLAEEY